MDANAKDFVVDSSFVLAALLPDENLAFPTEIFDKFTAGKISISSTLLLPFEITSALKLAVMRKRIDEDKAAEILNKFLSLDLSLEEINFNGVFKLAQKESLTGYDASYLWLAQKKNTQLLSLDKHLKGFTVSVFLQKARAKSNPPAARVKIVASGLPVAGITRVVLVMTVGAGGGGVTGRIQLFSQLELTKVPSTSSSMQEFPLHRYL